MFGKYSSARKAWDNGCPDCTKHEYGVYRATLEKDEVRQLFHHTALRAHLAVSH